MKRVHFVAVIALEYDTVQQVSEGIVKDRLGRNLVSRGYTVDDIHIEKLLLEDDVKIEQPPHIRRTDS